MPKYYEWKGSLAVRTKSEWFRTNPDEQEPAAIEPPCPVCGKPTVTAQRSFVTDSALDFMCPDHGNEGFVYIRLPDEAGEPSELFRHGGYILLHDTQLKDVARLVANALEGKYPAPLRPAS